MERRNSMTSNSVNFYNLSFEVMDQAQQVSIVEDFLGRYAGVSKCAAKKLIAKLPVPKISKGKLILIAELPRSINKTGHQRTVESWSNFILGRKLFSGIDLNLDMSTKYLKVDDKYQDLKEPRVYWVELNLDNLRTPYKRGLNLHTGLQAIMYIEQLAQDCAVQGLGIGLSEDTYTDIKGHSLSIQINYDDKMDTLKIDVVNSRKGLVYPSIK